MPCSFDLTSGGVRRVSYVTVGQPEPGAMGEVPPVSVLLGLLLLVVFATAIR